MLNFDYSEWVTVIFFAKMLAIIFLGSPVSYRIFFSAWRLLPSSDAMCNFDLGVTLVSVDQTTYHLYVKIYFKKLYLCPNSNLFIYICISSIGLFFSFSRCIDHCKIDSYVHQNASAFIYLDVSVDLDAFVDLYEYVLFSYRCICLYRFVCSPRCIYPYRCIISFRKILFI